jgi:hypothetical protein
MKCSEGVTPIPEDVSMFIAGSAVRDTPTEAISIFFTALSAAA